MPDKTGFAGFPVNRFKIERVTGVAALHDVNPKLV
jgi:hypothetical protein